MQDEQSKMEMQTQSNVQSSQAAAQSKMQAIQMEGQVKIELAKTDFEMEMEKMRQETALKLELMQREFEYNMQLKQADVGVKSQMDKQKEDAKDFRTKLQATQQSKMIEQRKNGTPAINFESTNDNMDNIDLSQFEPT